MKKKSKLRNIGEGLLGLVLIPIAFTLFIWLGTDLLNFFW